MGEPERERERERKKIERENYTAKSPNLRLFLNLTAGPLTEQRTERIPEES